MASFREDFIHVNQYTRPGLKLNGVKKLVIHYTANPGASAQNHHDYFDKSAVAAKRYASAHIFIDKKEAINIIPLNEVAYAANDVQEYVGGKPYRGVPALFPNANFLAIHVELCIEKDGTFHKDTLTRAVKVFAELCKKFNLNSSDIVRHYDITHKNCPAPFVAHPNDFAKFKSEVSKALGGKTEPKPATSKKTSSKSSTIYRVRKSANDAKSQIGAFKDVDNAIKLAKKHRGYEVYDEDEKTVYSASKAVSTKKTSKQKASSKSIVPYPGHLIKVGSKGKDVQRIQRAVGANPDGIFGQQTKKAVQAYQRRHGLVADGIVGKNTWSVMF